jgi:hypothetical protein
MSVEEASEEDVSEIEGFRRQDENAIDAGEFDPSLGAGLAPHRHKGGGRPDELRAPRNVRAGESIRQMAAERRQSIGCQSYAERLRRDLKSIRGWSLRAPLGEIV